MLLIAQEASANAGTLLTIGIAIATGLTGAIGVLWRRNETATKKIEDRSAGLEQRNQELNGQILELTKEVGEVKGKYDGITQMCETTLRTVDEAIRGKGAP